MWDALVDIVRATIFAGTHVLGGSLGTSIVVISTLVRLALLPLTLRAARQARAQQARLAELQPQLERLKKRFAKDPAQLIAETRAFYKKHDIKLSGTSVASLLVQLPLLGALFSAVRNGLGARVRFLWVADLSRADGLLALSVTALTAATTLLSPMPPGSPLSSRGLAVVVGVSTLAFLWSASSAVALSVGAGSAVAALQSWLLRRDLARERTAT